MPASFVIRLLPGGNYFFDDFSPGIVEEKFTVVAEIGITAEVFHKPGSVIAGGDLRYKKNNLLPLADGFF